MNILYKMKMLWWLCLEYEENKEQNRTKTLAFLPEVVLLTGVIPGTAFAAGENENERYTYAYDGADRSIRKTVCT